MFGKIIEELIAASLTEAQIADAIGATQPSVNRIRHGKQRPSYDIGDALMKLHARKCKGRRKGARRASA